MSTTLTIPIPQKQADQVAAAMGYPQGWNSLDVAGRRAVAMEIYRGQLDQNSQYIYDLLSTNNPNANNFQLIVSPESETPDPSKRNLAILIVIAAGVILLS